MSPLERPVPPAGEEIHLPGGSLHPVLMTVGLTLTLVGVTISPLFVVAGVILSVWVTVAWVREAREEFAHLPAEHDSHN